MGSCCARARDVLYLALVTVTTCIAIMVFRIESGHEMVFSYIGLPENPHLPCSICPLSNRIRTRVCHVNSDTLKERWTLYLPGSI